MQNVQKRLGYVTAMLVMLLTSFSAFSQETKKVDVDISTDAGGGGFFASPWVWVVGAAVFILLLVALLRGGNRREA